MSSIDEKYIPRVDNEVNDQFRDHNSCLFCGHDLTGGNLANHLMGGCNDSGYCYAHGRHTELDAYTGHCKKCLKEARGQSPISDGEEHELYGVYGF